MKQLLRQPLKTCVGVILMTLASAIIYLCIGQALAARSTKDVLDKQFSTVGIPTVQEDLDGNVNKSSFLVEDEFLAWQQKLTEQHPDIVKLVTQHGTLSAYIPELRPMNATQEKRSPYYSFYQRYQYQPEHEVMPYTCAMLVITLEEVSEPEWIRKSYVVENVSPEDFDSMSDYYAWIVENPDAEVKSVIQGYSVKLSGTVTEVVSLAEGYRDPVGRVARLTYTVPTLEKAEALELIPGEQYIVYGMDYSDEHWKLISTKNSTGELDYLDLENYDPQLFRFLTQEELDENAGWAEGFPEEMEYRKYLYAAYDTLFLTEPEYLQLNAISMTLATPVPQIEYEDIRDEQTGYLLELRPKTEVTYTDFHGETVAYSFEDYADRYRIPTIARLDGTVEAFLNSPEGKLWNDALSVSNINNHAFLTVGVDKMAYLGDFSLQRSQIVKGRDFSQEELEKGAKVCILHDAVAHASGISIGDTITLNLYSTDHGLPYQQKEGLLNPTAAFYFGTIPMAEAAEYTVVGLWHGQRLWPDVAKVSEYAFSPNTVFVPKASVETPMQYGSSILFNTLVLQNGEIEEFHDLAMNSGYAGRFKYNDQGYSVIAANFHNYETLARQMLTVGMVIYTVLLGLFLLFYPGSQKRSVFLMQSFGANFPSRFRFVIISSLGIVIPGSIMGGILGNLLWNNVVAALQATAESAVVLQIQPGVLAMLALAQMAFAATATWIISSFVAVARGMSSRR